MRISGSSIYKGDLAQIVDVDPSGQRATIRVVPRIEIDTQAGKVGVWRARVVAYFNASFVDVWNA